MKKEIEIIAENLRDLLSGELPGEKAHRIMIPETRRKHNPESYKREAAVLIILYPDHGGIKISFIKRTEYDGPHSGQISFPGGMKESIDQSLEMTAIREAAEETGINMTDLQVLGKLSPITIPVSSFRVQPYVAFTPSIPEFNPDPVEVEYMINIPISHLLLSKNRKKEKWNFGTVEAEIPFFSFENFKIWGATAQILSEFLEVIGGIEPNLWSPGYFDNDYNDT